MEPTQEELEAALPWAPPPYDRCTRCQRKHTVAMPFGAWDRCAKCGAPRCHVCAAVGCCGQAPMEVQA